MESRLQQLDEAFPRTAQRLVQLDSQIPVVYIGDIHGDQDAVECVLNRFPRPDHQLVFLGDVVDRGSSSMGSLLRIADAAFHTPSLVHLLMGNHEARAISSFKPADFWDALPPADEAWISEILSRLPLAAWHPSGLLGVHGALPDLDSLDAINAIESGSTSWRDITWGDWTSRDELSDRSGTRPAFGPSEFDRRRTQLGVEVLVRSHQPSAPVRQYGGRCLTLFTSSTYGRGTRQVALWNPQRPGARPENIQIVTL